MKLVYDQDDVKSFMMDSYWQAQLSPDPSTQNGAILLSVENEICKGHNNFPKGVSSEFWQDREAKYARVCHAEVSALIDAARQGVSTIGATLFCGWAACSNCAKYMALAGITKLVRHPYGDNTTGTHWLDDCLVGDEIMLAAGIEIVEIPPVTEWGGVLRRNGEDWRP